MLTRAIFSEGCKSVAAGMNPMDLRRGITLAVDKVLDYLKKHAKMISTTEEIAQVSAQPMLTGQGWDVRSTDIITFAARIRHCTVMWV